MIIFIRDSTDNNNNNNNNHDDDAIQVFGYIQENLIKSTF